MIYNLYVNNGSEILADMYMYNMYTYMYICMHVYIYMHHRMRRDR